MIRFDNRDVGLSERIEGTPDLAAIRRGDLSTLPYTLKDMAADSVGLLDALGIDRAHILGASMGGMVAQLMAIHWPERVRSLCLIMSSTGDRSVGQADPATMALMRRPAPATREGVVEAAVERSRALAGGRASRSTRTRHEPVRPRRTTAHTTPAGRIRQQAASIASADRTPELRGLRVPTVAIHGTDDRLVDISGGRAIADAVPGAWLEAVDGMGHGIVPEAWPQIIAAICRNAARPTASPGDSSGDSSGRQAGTRVRPRRAAREVPDRARQTASCGRLTPVPGARGGTRALHRRPPTHPGSSASRYPTTSTSR
ncbi:pimeloyl-ACP methyl ester carboxylesterase [Streptomyces sp. SAI-124]|uniref:alpha/beta fold hydrolase n=1 Tax=Streptomyces sp. SAI-124 TaxID=3377730 RepID=UPI003C7DBFE7